MERGERERWNKLSPLAKRIAAIVAKSGRASLSVNDLRSAGLADSRAVLAALRELEQRAFGKLELGDEADPVFVAILPALQTLRQADKIE